jgi:hypothetical protein
LNYTWMGLSMCLYPFMHMCDEINVNTLVISQAVTETQHVSSPVVKLCFHDVCSKLFVGDGLSLKCVSNDCLGVIDYH